MADVFISYSKSERALTEQLADDLRREGYVVWWDASLVSGEDYRTTIDKHLDEARVVIVIWTPSSITSKWVIAEAEHAARRGNLITLRTADLDPSLIPKPYGSQHTEIIENQPAILAAIRKLGVTSRYAGKDGDLSLHDRFWLEIETSEHPEDFELYLKDFPEGKHAAFARLKIARLQRLAPQSRSSSSSARTGSGRNDGRSNSTASNAISWLTLLSFWCAMGMAAYAFTEAMKRLDASEMKAKEDLAQAARLEKADAEAWSTVKSIAGDTIDCTGLRTYLTTYPTGKWAATARHALHVDALRFRPAVSNDQIELPRGSSSVTPGYALPNLIPASRCR